MPEAQPRGVQEQAPDAFLGQAPVELEVAILVVAQDRMADVREMHADLMRPARAQPRRDRAEPLADGERELRRAIALDSNYLPAWPNLAEALAKEGRLPESKAVLEHVLKLSPEYARARRALVELALPPLP